jgi:hypothetical protein
MISGNPIYCDCGNLVGPAGSRIDVVINYGDLRDEVDVSNINCGSKLSGIVVLNILILCCSVTDIPDPNLLMFGLLNDSIIICDWDLLMFGLIFF